MGGDIHPLPFCEGLMNRNLRLLYKDLGWKECEFQNAVRNIDVPGALIEKLRNELDEIKDQIRKYESPLYEALNGEEGE
jgi:hypothetical protein